MNGEIVCYPAKLRVNMTTAVEYVPQRLPFLSRKVMGDWYTMRNSPPNVRCYAVISQNTKTLFLWDDAAQQWFENADTFDQRAEYQRNKLRPQGVDIAKLSTNHMAIVMFVGYAHYIKARMGLVKGSVDSMGYAFAGERIRINPTLRRNVP